MGEIASPQLDFLPLGFFHLYPVGKVPLSQASPAFQNNQAFFSPPLPKFSYWQQNTHRYPQQHFYRFFNRVKPSWSLIYCNNTSEKSSTFFCAQLLQNQIDLYHPHAPALRKPSASYRVSKSWENLIIVKTNHWTYFSTMALNPKSVFLPYQDIHFLSQPIVGMFFRR